MMKDYRTMKVNEIKELAKEAKIKGWWEMKKADLIAALEALENEKAEEIAIENTTDEADTNETETSETDIEASEVVTAEEIKADTDENETKPKAKHRGNVIEFNGKAQNLEAWAKELGFRPQTLYGRIYVSGWTIEKAFTTPSKKATK